MSVGDAKCERCGRPRPGVMAKPDSHCYADWEVERGFDASASERECHVVVVARAPLDAEIAHLTAEVATLNGMIANAEKEHHRATRSYANLAREAATLRAKLDDAEARWRAAEALTVAEEGALFAWCDTHERHEHVEWSPADREYRCTEHTTREGAEEMRR